MMNRSILYQKFINDTESIFSTQSGYCIYNINPFKKIYEEEFGGGIGIIDINRKLGNVYIVGGGINPCFPTNNLVVRNYNTKENIEILYFNDIIRNIHVRDDIIVVSLIDTIFVYNINDYNIIRKFQTCNNLKGLFALNTNLGQNNKMRLVIPSKTQGELILYDKYSNFPLDTIKIHESPIEYFTINSDGQFLATCSTKGTVIKIYNFNTKEIKEYRRGYNQKKIHYLNFNNDCSKLICVSDTSLHVFKIDNILSYLDYVFNTNFSFCVYTCDGKLIRTQFLDDNNIIIYDKDKLIQIEYDDNGKCSVTNLNTVYSSSSYPFIK